MSRRYAPIWNEIKQKGICRITAPKVLHPRIRKAVIKEKFQDVGWKFLQAENLNGAKKLVFKSEDSVLIFRLVNQDIGAGDL